MRLLRTTGRIPPPGPCVRSGGVDAIFVSTLCSFAGSRLEVTMRLGSVGVVRGVERIEGNTLALTLRWLGCGLAGRYLCNPISKRLMVGNVQTYAYQLDVEVGGLWAGGPVPLQSNQQASNGE